MRLASFDIGFRNFAFAVEEFDTEKLEEFKRQRTAPLLLQSERPSKLECIIASGRTLMFHNEDLAGEVNPNMDGVYRRLVEYLDDFQEVWGTVDTFLIEQQMQTRFRPNIKALKISMHVYNYFLTHFPDARVVEYPAKNKSLALGAPPMKKPLLKKWTRDTAAYVFTEREDGESLYELAVLSGAKVDDIADTVCMNFSFVALYHLG